MFLIHNVDVLRGSVNLINRRAKTKTGMHRLRELLFDTRNTHYNIIIMLSQDGRNTVVCVRVVTPKTSLDLRNHTFWPTIN